MKRALLIFALLTELAWAEGTSTTLVWVPKRPVYGQDTSWAGTDEMRCNVWVAELNLSSIDAMGWRITGGLGGGGKCSFSIYNADGTTLLGTTGSVDCSATGNKSATGITPFNVTAGTKYQVCTCANTNGGSYLGATSAAGTLTSIQNVPSKPGGSSAPGGSDCLDAVPPSSVNPLTTPAAVNVPILILANGA